MTKTQLQGVGQNKLPKWANPACQSQPKQHLNPHTLFPSVPHGFSQVIATHGGKTIYISGQTAWDAEKKLVGGNSLVLQVKQALQNVGHAVEAAGGSLADIVALRLYVVNYRPADANSLGGQRRHPNPGTRGRVETSKELPE